MIDTLTGDYIDPLPFFKTKVKDTRAPQALGFRLIPVQGKGVVNGKTGTHEFLPAANAPIIAWGELGCAIKAYDYADAAPNRMGVYDVSLKVDGEEVYRSVVDRFAPQESRMINAWAEDKYMRSFIAPGNTLRMMEAKNGNRGIVTIDEQRDYIFQYTLKDYYGNTARYRFVVRGKKQPIEPFAPREKYYFAWDKVNILKEPGLDLIVPRGRLYEDIVLNYSAYADSAAIAYTYHLHHKAVPLHTYADLQIGLLRDPMADSTKYYIARIDQKGKRSSAGGKYENGFVKTRIRELDTYTVAIDTIPPKVLPVARTRWPKTERIVYEIKEEESGLKSYRGTIDGEYALFGLNIMNDRITYRLDPKRVKRGVPHEVEITVTDNCGNTTVVKDTISY